MNTKYQIFYAIDNNKSPFGHAEGAFETHKSNPEKSELLKMVLMQAGQKYRPALEAATAMTIGFFQIPGGLPEDTTRFEYTREEIQNCLNEQ